MASRDDMIRHPERIPAYIRQYQRVPQLVRVPFDPFIGEQVLNHLLDRDAMEGMPELVDALADADRLVSSALSETSNDWWESLQRWSAQCGFAKSLWWISVQYGARRRGATPLSLIDAIGSMADTWFKAFGERMREADAPVRTDAVHAGFHKALLVGVAQYTGLERERVRRGRRLPDYLSRYALALPVVVVPGSVVIGFQLARAVPGEPASPPADESVGALDIVMSASARYEPSGDSDILGDLVEDGDDRVHLWDGLKQMYNAAGPEVERIEILSRTHGEVRIVPWEVTGKAVRRPRESVAYTLSGNVRAIDLDRHSLRIRKPGCTWTSAVTVTPSLFLTLEDLAQMVIGKTVTVQGTTKDALDPPRSMVAESVSME